MSYVYIRSKYEKLWVTGFYAPNGEWIPESDHATAEAAAKQVHWLNGGKEDAGIIGKIFFVEAPGIEITLTITDKKGDTIRARGDDGTMYIIEQCT